MLSTYGNAPSRYQLIRSFVSIAQCGKVGAYMVVLSCLAGIRRKRRRLIPV